MAITCILQAIAQSATKQVGVVSDQTKPPQSQTFTQLYQQIFFPAQHIWHDDLYRHEHRKNVKLLLNL
jgi:hypothetical protein